MGYDMSALGDQDKITDPINVDIAASTQKLSKSAIFTRHVCLIV